MGSGILMVLDRQQFNDYDERFIQRQSLIHVGTKAGHYKLHWWHPKDMERL